MQRDSRAKVAFENIWIELEGMRIFCDGVLKVLFGKVGCSQVAVERGRAVAQRYRLFVILDCLAVLLVNVSDDAEIIESLGIELIYFSGALELAAGIIVMQ